MSGPVLLPHVLPGSIREIERALAVEVERLLALDIPLRDLWNPDTCPLAFLPYLAWTLSVDLWDPDWDEDRKRTVVRAAVTDQRIKGTEALLRRYVSYMGGSVVQILTRPQGLYVDGATPEMVADYLAQMPEIRTYLASLIGERDQGLYIEEDFLDDGFFLPDRGSALYNRISTLHDDGVETPLVTYSRVDTTTTGTALDTIEVVIPGSAEAALFLGDGFLDEDFLDGSVEPRFVRYVQDTAYERYEADFPVTYVRPDLKPVTPRYERASKIGSAGWALMLDADFLEDGFLVPDASNLLVFDRLRLFDPDVLPPDGLSDGFLDDARLDMPGFTAEVLVEVQRTAGLAEIYLDADFIADGFLVADDLTKQNQIMDAITAAKSLRDRVLVAFDTHKTITFGDIIQLDGSTRFDQTLRRYL